MHLIRFQTAQQRKLLFPRQCGHLRDLRLRDLVCIDSRHADALVVYEQHDSHSINFRSLEDAPENKDHEFHRSVIVIVQQYFVQRWLLEPRLALSDNSFFSLKIQIRHTEPEPAIPPISYM